MDEKQILSRIDDLVAEEHELRGRSSSGHPLGDEDRTRLRHLEEHLDQYWDLLRQRRARREAGQDPGEVEERPVDEVESYLQ